jgi:hypothetical protein
MWPRWKPHHSDPGSHGRPPQPKLLSILLDALKWFPDGVNDITKVNPTACWNPFRRPWLVFKKRRIFIAASRLLFWLGRRYVQRFDSPGYGRSHGRK